MKPSPLFSIVIPTHNRTALLTNCLRGIAAIEYPRAQFQVIVVNDGGAPIPEALTREWKDEFELCVLIQKNRGAGAARNAGAARARYEWLAFTDDDCVPTRDWLSELARAAAAHPNAALGGETCNGLRENVHAEASECLALFLREYYHRRKSNPSQVEFFASNNFALPLRIFDAIGGFDERFRHAEDRDLCARLRTSGCALHDVPMARVVHSRAMNLVEFWGQHEANGAGAYDYHQNRARHGAHDLRLEPFEFYRRMMEYPGHYAPRTASQLRILIALSQAANAFGFLRQTVRARLVSRSVRVHSGL